MDDNQNQGFPHATGKCAAHQWLLQVYLSKLSFLLLSIFRETWKYIDRKNDLSLKAAKIAGSVS